LGFVFDRTRTFREKLAEKPLDMALKLPPPFIHLLIHGATSPQSFFVICATCRP